MSLFESASLVVTPNGTKASKLYAIKPTSGAGDLTVVRATTATRVNSAGLIESVAVNVPRLDYLNSTCPSVLVEPQRTNLNTYSEDFSNVSYTKTALSITTNATTAPDGNTTADKMVENNALTAHTMFKDIAVTISNPYTLSVFAKAGERTKLWLDFFGGVNVAVFDLINGTVIITSGTGLTASIVNYGNGWYRCSITQNAVSAILYPNIAPTINNTTSPTYQGNGTSGIFIWGMELEAGAYATSYIPTVASTVTRNADVISKTGISSLIGQTEGTIFLDFYYDGISNNFVLMQTYQNANQLNVIQLLCNSSKRLSFEVGADAVITATNPISAGRIKIGAAYKNNDFVLYVNGTQIGTDTSGTVIATDSINFNDFVFIPNVYKQLMKINSSILWKSRLTNAELAEITTL